MASDLLNLLGRIAEPLDYPRRALWRIPSAIREGDWGALLPAIAGLGATAVGTMAGMPWLGAGLGSLLGGAAYGVGQDLDPVKFRNPTSKDLLEPIFGEGTELPGWAEFGLASTVGDPLFWTGLPALKYAGKAMGAAREAPSALRRALGGIAGVAEHPGALLDDAAIRAAIREGATANWGGMMIDPVLERSAMQGAMDAADAARRLRARQIRQVGGVIEPSLPGEALDVGAGAIGRSMPVDVSMFPQSYVTPIGRQGSYGQIPLDLQLAPGQWLGQLPELGYMPSSLPSVATEAVASSFPATLRKQLQRQPRPGKIPPLEEIYGTPHQAIAQAAAEMGPVHPQPLAASLPPLPAAMEPVIAAELKPPVVKEILPSSPTKLPISRERLREQIAEAMHGKKLSLAASSEPTTLREALTQNLTGKAQTMSATAAQTATAAALQKEANQVIVDTNQQLKELVANRASRNTLEETLDRNTLRIYRKFEEMREAERITESQHSELTDILNAWGKKAI